MYCPHILIRAHTDEKVAFQGQGHTRTRWHIDKVCPPVRMHNTSFTTDAHVRVLLNKWETNTTKQQQEFK